MKKIFLFLSISIIALTSCDGPQGPPGVPGDNSKSEVFELLNINFLFDNESSTYRISQSLTPPINDSDVILIYRLSGTIDSQTPIWQLIPRTLFLPEGELDYDFDFSREDFTISAGGDYNLATTPSYIQNQTFRIVIIPGYFSKSANTVDKSDYNAVIAAYNIDDTNVTVLNKK